MIFFSGVGAASDAPTGGEAMVPAALGAVLADETGVASDSAGLAEGPEGLAGGSCANATLAPKR